jgi:hypothetical protein
MNSCTSRGSRLGAAPALVSCVIALGGGLGACADPGEASSPDGGIEPAPPVDPAGRFLLDSTFSLAEEPAAIVPALAILRSATDGPDDPGRFLVDHVVAHLPEGYARLVATTLAPYVAAYVQQRIDAFAPELAPAARELVVGLGRIATRFGTIEELAISRPVDPRGSRERHGDEPRRSREWHDGPRGSRRWHGDDPRGAGGDGAAHARHTLTGVSIDGVRFPFAMLGVTDEASDTRVTLIGDRLQIGAHAVRVPYGVLLRAGLDRVVVPGIVPGARDLASALTMLVDCDRLGELIANRVLVGSPSLYTGACIVALTRIAASIYDELPGAAHLADLSIAGEARAVDLDGDGPMDVIEDGTWTGMLSGVPLASSRFAGASP